MDEQQEPKRRVRMERFTWHEGDLRDVTPDDPRPRLGTDNDTADQQ